MNLNYIESYFDKRGNLEAVEFLCIENYCVRIITNEETIETVMKKLLQMKEVPNREESSEEWRIRNFNLILKHSTWTVLMTYGGIKEEILKYFYSSNKSNVITCSRYNISPSELFEIRYEFCVRIYDVVWGRNLTDFPPTLMDFILPNPW